MNDAVENKHDAKAKLLVERLTASQSRLYAYIYSLTRDPDAAWDILQETNRLLWSRVEMYDPAQEFLPWAFTHAFNQIRTWRKRQQRDRLVCQDERTLLQVEATVSRHVNERVTERSVALEHCLDTLADRQRKLVKRIYTDGATLDEIASDQGARTNTVAVALHRIRQTLANCIKLRIEQS